MHRGRVLALVACLTGCALGDGNGGEVADVRGSWEYSGNQVAPALALSGSLVVQTQSSGDIGGQLSWQEPDGIGGMTLRGGPVTGRVLGLSDIDFDVIVGGNARRHVARISHDSIIGLWAESASGKSGQFVAVRATP